jgi:hypothetical protein
VSHWPNTRYIGQLESLRESDIAEPKKKKFMRKKKQKREKKNAHFDLSFGYFHLMKIPMNFGVHKL